jgi:adenosylcobinamide-GDP ribazoletransferase
MAYGRRFILMMQFMTSIPINVNVKAEKEDYGKGLALAPVVGLIIGLIVAAVNFIFGKLFPASVTSVITVAIYVGLTGGLHFDGLGDTADGLFSNRSKEKILEIMKDSRIGTNALLTVVITVLMYVTLIRSLGDSLGDGSSILGDGSSIFILMLMPVAGRIGSLIASGTSDYAGVSDGPGRWCVEYCGKMDVYLGVFIYSAIFLTAAILSNGYFLLLPAVSAPVSAFVLSKFLGKKLGGVTGDILGAVCELNQVIFLVIAFASSKLL